MRIVIIALFASLLLSTQLSATPIIPAPPSIAASSYLLMDANSGQVLVEHNADTPLPPASLTKLMTSYVLAYELKQGHIANDDLVTISENAWAQNPLFEGSSLMWIEVGKQVPLLDLHRGIIISSGNDASVAIAEYVAGSEIAFVDLMNQHAQRLGMAHSHFMNVHGLPHPDHYTTAHDLILLAKALLGYPDVYALYSEQDYRYNNIRTINRNRLLFSDDSVDGLKTGHTEEAGYCLVTSAQRDNMRLISVVMGASSERAREQATQQLLAYGFRYFETYAAYQQGEILAKTKVWGGATNQLTLGVDRDIYLTIPRGSKDQLTTIITIDDPIKAPIDEQTVYGDLVVMFDDSTALRQPLVALESIDSGGFFKRLWASTVLLFQ